VGTRLAIWKMKVFSGAEQRASRPLSAEMGVARKQVANRGEGRWGGLGGGTVWCVPTSDMGAEKNPERTYVG